MKIERNDVSGLYELILTEREDLIVHGDPDDLSEEDYNDYEDLMDTYFELTVEVEEKNKQKEPLTKKEEVKEQVVIPKTPVKVKSTATKESLTKQKEVKKEVQTNGNFNKLLESMAKSDKEKAVANTKDVSEPNKPNKTVKQKEPLTKTGDRELEYLNKALSLGKNSTRFSLNGKNRELLLKAGREINQEYRAYDLRLEKFGVSTDFDMVNIEFKESTFEIEDGIESNYGWLRLKTGIYYPTSFSLVDVETGEFYEAITLTDSRFDELFEGDESSYDRLGMYFVNGLGLFQVLIPAYGVYLRYIEGSLKSGKREDYNYNVLVGKKYPKCKTIATLAFDDLKEEQIEF